MFKVEFSKQAVKQLSKLDKNEARFIMAWIGKNLEGCDNPRLIGKALKGNYAGAWRYRVGNYRIITEIQDEKVIIIVLNIGHRRDVYDSQT